MYKYTNLQNEKYYMKFLKLEIKFIVKPDQN